MDSRVDQKRRRVCLVACLLALDSRSAVQGVLPDDPAWGLSVRRFGAKGDGVVDDTRAIQAALDACAAEARGRVFLPPGSYLVSTIWIQGSVALVGAGIANTKLIVRAQTNGPCIANAGSDNWDENVTVRDLSILGRGEMQTNAHDSIGIRLDGVHNFTLERLRVSGTRSHGIAVIAGMSGVLRDCAASGAMNQAHSGFLFGSSRPTVRQVEAVHVTNCSAENNGQDGFTVEQGADIRLDSCRAIGNGETGVKIASANQSLVSNCYARDNRNGFKTQNKNRSVIFSNNIAHRNLDSGYFISNISKDGAAEAVVLAGNVSSDNGQRPLSTSYGYAVEARAGTEIRDLILSGNIAIDRQAVPTQTRGFSFGESGLVSAVVLSGNSSVGSRVPFYYGRSLHRGTLKAS